MQQLLQWSRRHNFAEHFSSVLQRISEGRLRVMTVEAPPRLGLIRLGILFAALLALLAFSTAVRTDTHNTRDELYRLRVDKSEAQSIQEELYLQINNRTQLRALNESAIEFKYTPNIEVSSLGGTPK